MGVYAVDVTQALSDPADLNACLSERADAGVRLLPPQISLVLDPLGRNEQRRVDRGRADDLANLSHRSSHSLEEACQRAPKSGSPSLCAAGRGERES